MRRRTWGRLALAAGAGLVLFGNQGFRGLVHNWRELRQLRREIERYERERRLLERRIQRLPRSEAVLEGLARKELGFIKPGEVEYRFKPPPPAR